MGKLQVNSRYLTAKLFVWQQVEN